jgi:hypothetical protein
MSSAGGDRYPGHGEQTQRDAGDPLGSTGRRGTGAGGADAPAAPTSPNSPTSAVDRRHGEAVSGSTIEPQSALNPPKTSSVMKARIRNTRSGIVSVTIEVTTRP